MHDEIKLILKAVSLPDKRPLISIAINGEAREYTLDKELNEFILPLRFGKNEISITFLNKSPKDTKVIDGAITDDLAVIINELSYRSHDFVPWLGDIGRYIVDGREITGTHGYMSFPGTYTICIDSPVFIFVREQTHHGRYRNTVADR